MYAITRPVERKDIKTAWAVAGVQKIKVINRGVSGIKTTGEFVSIDIKRGHITFYRKAASALNFKAGDLISFVFLDKSLYLYRSVDGNTLCKLKDGGFRVIHRTMSAILNKEFGASKTMRYTIKPTKSTFGGSIMYELILPRHLQRQYDKKKPII